MSSIVAEEPSTYEIERGKPIPSFNHGAIQMNLGVEFASSREYRVVSEVTLDLGGRPYATPDLSVYKRGVLNLRRDEIRATAIPIQVVEILSPTQGNQEILDRFDRYFAKGVKTCWLVEPHIHTITIFQADGSETILHEGVAEDPATGLKADLARVFA